MKKTFVIILVILSLIGTFLMGRKSVRIPEPIVQIDTILRIDTLHIEKPVPVIHYRDTGRLLVVNNTDTLHVHDTLFVPTEIKVYQDSLYKCQISGYKPSLDWIEVYSRERLITRTETKEIGRKWGIGIQAGYGVNKNGLTPFLGVGIQYNLLSW